MTFTTPFVHSVVSFQFDFDNPMEWTAHDRRDFIENLSDQINRLTPTVLQNVGERIGVTFSNDQMLGRVHTPWVGEQATRVMFQPTIPSILIDRTQTDNQQSAKRFEEGVLGRAALWLAHVLTKRPTPEILLEMERGALDKRLKNVSAQWGAMLIDPILRSLGPWLAQYSKNGVSVTVRTPEKNITVQLPSLPPTDLL